MFIDAIETVSDIVFFQYLPSNNMYYSIKIDICCQRIDFKSDVHVPECKSESLFLKSWPFRYFSP